MSYVMECVVYDPDENEDGVSDSNEMQQAKQELEQESEDSVEFEVEVLQEAPGPARRQHIIVLGVEYILPPENVTDEQAVALMHQIELHGVQVDVLVLLTFWGLAEIESNIKDHKIFDTPTLLSMTQHDVNVITNIVGLRVRLRHLIVHMRMTYAFPIPPEPLTTAAPNYQPSTSQDTSAATPNQTMDSLEKLLLASDRGRLIIREYNKNDILCDDSRNILIEIIILAAYEQNLGINNTFFKIMAEKIEALFPKEKKSLYFTPSVPGITRAGARFVVRKPKIFNKFKLNSDKKRSTEQNESPAIESMHDPAKQEESKKWLERGRTPKDLVITHWDTCYDLRRSQIKSANSLQEIVKEYPIITTALGGNMIIRDFEKGWPGALNRFFENIVKVHDNLPVMFNRLSCEEHKKLAAVYQQPETDINLKNLIFAKLITTLIPKLGRITKEWRPSHAESQKGFILFAQTSAAVDEKIASRKQFLREKNCGSRRFHLQPTVMAIGPESKLRFTVVFDNVIYQYQTIVDAIAGVIAISFVLDLEYNADATPAWTFIQEHFFKIPSLKQIQVVDEAARLLVTWT